MMTFSAEHGMVSTAFLWRWSDILRPALSQAPLLRPVVQHAADMVREHTSASVLEEPSIPRCCWVLTLWFKDPGWTQHVTCMSIWALSSSAMWPICGKGLPASFKKCLPKLLFPCLPSLLYRNLVTLWKVRGCQKKGIISQLHSLL